MKSNISCVLIGRSLSIIVHFNCFPLLKMLVMKGYYRTAAESGVDDDEFYVVVDGSHQRND